MKNSKGLTQLQMLIGVICFVAVPLTIYKLVSVISLEKRPEKISEFRKELIENWDFSFGMNNQQKVQMESEVDLLKEQVHLLSKRLCLLAKKTNQKIVECARYDAILDTEEFIEDRKKYRSCANELDFSIYQGHGVCLSTPMAMSVGECLGEKLVNKEPGNFVAKIEGEYYCLRFRKGIKKFTAKRIYTGTCYHICKNTRSLCIGEIEHKGKRVPACLLLDVEVTCREPFQVLREMVCEQTFDKQEGVVYFSRMLLDASKDF